MTRRIGAFILSHDLPAGTTIVTDGESIFFPHLPAVVERTPEITKTIRELAYLAAGQHAYDAANAVMARSTGRQTIDVLREAISEGLRAGFESIGRTED